LMNVGEYHLIIFGTLFILIVLFLPGGLVEVWKRLQKRVSRSKNRERSNSSQTTNH